ncbi:MAG TPA: glycosyltransferase [Catenuloplanes sp.]
MSGTVARPAHVAVVVPTMGPAGAERVARALAEEFVKGARVTVVTFDPRLSRRALARTGAPPWAGQIPAGCDHVHLPATSSGPRRLVVLAARFARLARRRRFDVVYSFLTYTNIVVAAARVAGVHRFVHVASEHAMAESLRGGPRGARLLARTLPVVYRVPDHLVVVSDAARRSLTAAGVVPRPARAVTVHNPINLAAVRGLASRPVANADLDRLRRRGPVLACFARLHAQKDHPTLLRALRLLPSTYSLLLVGDGPQRTELARIARELGVADRTTFVGAVDNPYPIMSRVDVVVLASVEEGFGLVALEAAALGVPFVGSDVGGLSEVCSALGHPTFPVGDAVALAAVITGLAGRRGPPVAADRLSPFDVAHVASRYLALARPVPHRPVRVTA